MSRNYADYSNAMSGASAIANQNMAKLQNYSQVKKGVDAYNKANETGNYIKDGLDTGMEVVKDATIESVVVGAPKAALKLGNLAMKGIDSRLGNVGGLEGLGDRLKDAASDAIRSKTGMADRKIYKRDYEKKEGEEDEEGEEGEGDAAEGGGDAAEGGGDVAADAGDAAVGAGEDAAADAGELAANAGEDGAAAVGEGLAEIGGEVAGEAALDLLDATGVGAIVGIPLQIATGVGMVYSIADVGNSLYHDMSDIFGGGAKKGNQIAAAMPKMNTSVIAPVLET